MADIGGARGIHVEGLDELLKKMDKLGPKAVKAANEGLKRAGMNIIADAQENLKTNGWHGNTINATGQLSASGRVQETRDGLDVGFFSQGSDEGHAAIVEFGSTKKWWAPRKYLQAWAKIKLGAEDGLAWGIATKIQKKIHERGLAPHPFFRPAVSRNKDNIGKAIKEAVNKAIGK